MYCIGTIVLLLLPSLLSGCLKHCNSIPISFSSDKEENKNIMNLEQTTDAVPRRFKRETWRQILLLSFQSLGVVYGRLSTAPLYVFSTIELKEFNSKETVYGYLSFIFWTLTTISLLKYAFLVLSTDEDGEGGPFALYSILCRYAKFGLLPSDGNANEVMNHEENSSSGSKIRSRAKRAIENHKTCKKFLLLAALLGACMIIGDAVLTPSISVLAASSSLHRSLAEIKYSSSPKTQKSISHALKTYVKNNEPKISLCIAYLYDYVPVPFACVILVCIFMLQHYGTHKIGFALAPVVITWLIVVGGVGLYNVFHWNPEILSAISPVHMFRFIKIFDYKSLRSLGSILLCVAGSEAMFADLGHFSKKSIKFSFVCLIYPILVLCYAGQAAFISKNLNAEDFNNLSTSVPNHVRHIFVVLSLLASAVGSQATITASFSIINQCLALGCFPRVKVIHTSDKRQGQVYIPDVNWLLMLLSLTVTIGFHDTQRIAKAAGLAIVSGMLVTTCLMSLVIVFFWKKSLFSAGCFLLFFGFIEGMYLSACLLSFHKGAWYLALLLALLLTIMLAWNYGTRKKYEFDLQNKVPAEWLTGLRMGLGVSRVPGIGFIYTDIATGIPAFFSHFITNLPAFHQVLIFVSFKSLSVPHVPSSERYLVGRVGAREDKIYRCIVRYGFCDQVRDTDDFEEQIIHSIGEFITLEENDTESQISPEGRMMFIPKSSLKGNALIPLHDSPSTLSVPTVNNNEIEINTASDLVERTVQVRSKKVRFMLPEISRRMPAPVREELQELVDARESGTAYFLGQSHLAVRDSRNIFKRFLILIYVFLDRNCREPHVALNIPHAALLEVGTVYTI